jgi:ubiquinone/menaquinone biosynthesis C-methylase UbiE
MKKTLSLVLGAVLAGGLSVVNADELLALTDAQMDGVTAGVGFTSFTQIDKIVNIQEIIIEQKAALFEVVTSVVGFSAVAEAEADSEGPNADAQTFTFAEITPTVFDDGSFTGYWKANSLSKSIALASP